MELANTSLFSLSWTCWVGIVGLGAYGSSLLITIEQSRYQISHPSFIRNPTLSTHKVNSLVWSTIVRNALSRYQDWLGRGLIPRMIKTPSQGLGMGSAIPISQMSV